ncbi:hypothetical protein CTheo_2823 [Ceratobasidium theobromae]|uniref:Uncharacterized protein n=1 Tax=Ceratobasidium theobromae TaxID=1582974 RepID=A0A5N5QQ90_9AGAM|nr:hypothetical protein CTheo_2823 [Ceratobasidium theobromae]
MSSDDERALKQFEFYFDDANLPYDKFMWKLHTQNDAHWVPIATVASFKRMREFQPKGHEWLVSVLRKSDGLLEVDESGTNVRRTKDILPPKDQFERSVYAKGFPDETPELQAQLETFFGEFGKVNAVRMRRTEQKVFKNSVFVEFADFDSVGRFLEADPKPTFQGNELLTMSKEAYCAMKIKEKGLDKKGITPRTHSGTGGAGGRRQFDAFQLKDGVLPKDKKEKDPIKVNFHGKEYTVNSEGKVDVPIESFEYTKRSALKFTGAGSDDPRFGEIKIPLKEKFTPLPFIKMDKGANEGIFGFGHALSEEDIAFLKEKVPTIAGGQVTWEPLSDDQERSFHYWRLQDQAKRAISDSQTSSKHKGNNFKGGRKDHSKSKPRSPAKSTKPRSAGAEKPKLKKEEAGEPVEVLKAGKTRGEVEPSGDSAGQGIRGTAVPTVVATSSQTKRKAEDPAADKAEKKPKVEE